MRYTELQWRIKLKYAFWWESHLLYFIRSVSLANSQKSFSQFRLHFRLCLGSCVEKASCLPWDGVQVGFTSISFMILFETSQSHETPPYPYLMPHPYLGIYCTATSMLHHWWGCYPMYTLQCNPNVRGGTRACPGKLGTKIPTAHLLHIDFHKF